MSDFSSRLYFILKNYPSSDLIDNLDATIEKYQSHDNIIITSIVDTIKPNCYIASPYSMMISYAEDELIKVNAKIYRSIAYFLIRSFESVLKFVNIDKVQTLNNYLLSTNFFSQRWEQNINIHELTITAIERHHTHALLIRSVNAIQNPYLFEHLIKRGWIPLVSRQVYLFRDWEKCHKKYNFILDQKLLISDRFVFEKPQQNDLFAFSEAQRLYNLLYLQKYSIHNIHFTAKYLQQLAEQNLLHIRLLKDTLHNRYIGVAGMLGEGGVITAPIIGYDTTYPISDALYRRLIAYVTTYAMEHNYLLNLSSGAPSFKTLRGAEAHFEYMFVYIKHLSLKQRVVWKILSFIANSFYAPILKRFKL